jgi:hypothetical protein
VQNWNALMKAFMKEYYSPGKTQSLHNKMPLLLSSLRRLSRRHSNASMSTLGRFHIISSQRTTSC